MSKEAATYKFIWVTKYALTSGIYEVHARIFSNGTSVVTNEGSLVMLLKKDWSETKSEAIKVALKKIEAKEKSLARAQTKLNKLKESLKVLSESFQD